MASPGPKSSALERLPDLGERADEVELGSIIGVFGVTGEVRLHLHNPSSQALAREAEVVLIDRDGARWRAHVSARSGAGKRVVGRLRGLADRDVARSLQGWSVWVPKASLPAPADDEFYVWQLEGLEARIDGKPVGTIHAVVPAGPNDLLEIHGVEGAIAFVPMLSAFVRSIDLAGGAVHLSPGALDEPGE